MEQVNCDTLLNIKFDWDDGKAALNIKKHGVRFYEAKSVFFDGNAKVIHDPEHSSDEERFIILGLSMGARMLVVMQGNARKKAWGSPNMHQSPI